MRRVLTLIVGLLLLSNLPSVRADDEPAVPEGVDRKFARERLVEEARRKVGGMRPTAERLQGVRDAIGEDIRFLTSYEPKDEAEVELLAQFEQTIEERVLLTGRSSDGEDDAGEPGAILEAVTLTLWLNGEEPCYVVVADPKVSAEKAQEYPYPPAPPAPKKPVEAAKTPTPEGGEGVAEENAGLGPAPAGPPPADPAAGEAPAKAGGAENGEKDGGEKTEAEVPPAPEPVEVTESAEPWTPPSPEDWASSIVLPAEGGSLRGKQIHPGQCSTVDQLLRAAKSQPIWVHPDVGRLVRHAIVEKDIFAYNVPSIAVRREQMRETLDVLEADVPSSGLVDENMVGLKSQNARKLRGKVRTIEAKQEALRELLDQMVLDLDGWKTQAALLSREIEDERDRIKEAAKAAPPAPESDEEGPAAADPEGQDEAAAEEAAAEEDPPEPPKTLRLRLAEAHESLVGLDLRLFYLTVLRAERRLELLDVLRRAADSEATSAESVLTRFEEELVRIRNERRLDRLRSSERQLRQWTASEKEKEPAEGSVGALRVTAYEAVLEMNRVAQEAVLQRRVLTGRGSAAEAERNRSAEGETEEKKPPKTDKPAAKQLNVLMRTPHLRTWDEKFIESARADLEDPDLAGEFDAHLVAEHYDAVNDRVTALAESVRDAPDASLMRAAFSDVETAAKEALKPLDRDYLTTVVRRLPRILTACREDCDSAVQGIEDQIARNRERLVQLAGYRNALTQQGTRSLLIREGRTVSNAQLAAALQETGSAADQAGSWLTGKGELNIGRFARKRWLTLLLALGVLVGGVWATRRARRLVDGWIQKRAAVHPELQGTGVSVEQEQEEVRKRKEEQAEARASAPTDVLEQVREEFEAELGAEPAAAEESETAKSETAESEEPKAEDPEAEEAKPERPVDPLAILDEEDLAKRRGDRERTPDKVSPPAPSRAPEGPQKPQPEERR